MDIGSSSYGSGRDPRRRRRQQARRRLLLLIVVVVVVVGAVAALALSRGHKDGGSGKSGEGVAATPKPTTPPPKVWVATPADPVRVWVGGDSMGGELGWGLGPMLDKAKVFKPILYYKESSGIARWDFFDWGKKLDSVMATARPAAVAIMMGTNDTQSISDNGHWTAYGTSDWKKKYGKRVGEMMQAMLDGGARRVYWVGMPIMKQDWRNSRMKLINSIIAEQAAKHPGAQYIDVWPLFTTASGSFDPKWRGPDGVHFTVAGQDRLASAVYAVIKKQWAPYGLPSATPSPSSSGSATPPS